MNNHECTYEHLKLIYSKALEQGYRIITCQDYFVTHQDYFVTHHYVRDKVLINRIDIDLSLEKADKVLQILNSLGIQASFFIRLHAREYNPFSFENFRIIKDMISTGHEIGLHSEMMDCSKIWDEIAVRSFIRDIQVLQSMIEYIPTGVASHGSNLTGTNNLNFWKNHSPKEYGLLYEAYDPIFFNNLYCSIGLAGWKTYRLGHFLKAGECVCKYIKQGYPVIYLNLHPIKFFERHCYE